MRSKDAGPQSARAKTPDTTCFWGYVASPINQRDTTIDWRAVGGEFHQIELPAFPGVLLPAVFLPGDGKLYFPVGHVCAALGAQDKRQREKVKRDFPESIVDLSLPTTKGDRPMVCIEWEALGAWLVTIHEGRVAEEQRGKLRVFKTQVWKAASDILMGKHQALRCPHRKDGVANSLACGR